MAKCREPRNYFQNKRIKMLNKKNQQSARNQSSVGMMIQRCHKWRQKRKQYMDQARVATDEIERERLLQAAEHYGRIVNEEQSKIDSTRDPKDKTPVDVPTADAAATDGAESAESSENVDDEENAFPMFLTTLN